MDKNAIKKYATWARRELISRVSQKAEFYGVTAEEYGDFHAASIDGRVLSPTEKMQRQALIDKVRSEGYEQAMEEVAYTWFNRFSALRYMEVNNYLPTRVRVFTNENGEFKPQILDEAIHLELDGLDMEKVYSLKETNDTEALYRYLLITQCNALSKIMPVMFQKIADYTELLLPDYLLREGSVIEQMVTSIPEEDWTDQVQIIGWLYQYYNAEKKDEVFAALKKNVKITKENIPAATQLFTPDWIVRYMVENSPGRLWVEGHPNEQLKSGWKYYLEEAKQKADVEAQLAEIRREYAALKPEEILCIDPCAGSGHILDYLFDVLMQIYTDYGYTTSEAVRSIVENNLYGLDIDERAAQLAYFSVMMKARSYDRRFLTRKGEDGNPDIPQPHVYAIVESNHLNQLDIEYFTNNDPKLKKDFGVLVDELHDAKEYGSILNITQVDFSALYARMDEVRSDISMYKEPTLKTILPLIQVAEALAQKYHVVVTNPPYMGSTSMTDKLLNYIKNLYLYGKSDLYATFIERCEIMTKKSGYQAMITQHSWMFLSSFEKLRSNILHKDTINMSHLGSRAFEEISGEVVQTTSFVIRNCSIKSYVASYVRLIEGATQQEKESIFLSRKKIYYSSNTDLSMLPGKTIMYWMSKQMLSLFIKGKELGSIAFPKQGLASSNNDKYLRLWFEVSIDNLSFSETSIETAGASGKRWFPHCKGGGFRKWYGNREYVINWEYNGQELRNDKKAVVRNPELYFKEGFSYSDISTGNYALRYYGTGFIFDSSGPMIFLNENNLLGYDGNKLLALLNSNSVNKMLSFLCPTIHYTQSSVAKIPLFPIEDSCIKASECVELSRLDWDSFETSWNFKRHPFIRSVPTVSDAFTAWQNECATHFAKLKANEEELNRIFIDIYGLQDELTPVVEDKDVTVRLADKARDFRSFISYAVGCMFGRYSLDVDGLVYAGGAFDQKYCRWICQFGDGADKYIDENGELKPGEAWAGSTMWEYDGIRKDGHWVKTAYCPDTDGIIPICDDEYFPDDIVDRFVEFIKVVYGEKTLEENLQFIADALDGTGTPRQVIRNYFIYDFYNDHCKIYQKRPIYWLFDSGRKNGFKCLIYIHRYKPDTIARIRTDYVHEQQARYRTAIAGLENRIENVGTGERVKLNKQLKKLQDQADELHGYEEKIHHLADQFISIDLDDGVKHNYEIFKDVLAKIK